MFAEWLGCAVDDFVALVLKIRMSYPKKLNECNIDCTVVDQGYLSAMRGSPYQLTLSYVC